MQPHIIILTLVALAFIPEVIWITQLFRNKAQEANLPRITLRINLVVCVLGLMLTAVAVMYDVNFINYKAPIEYSDWKTIQWSDFHAIKRPHQTLQGSQTFAFITSEIDIEQLADYAVVKTLFHPARSYTFSEESSGQSLMQHELYHLHITEYVAREIRKEFSDCMAPCNTEFINAYLQRERELQNSYDEETAHGYLLGKQRTWQTRIDSCLSSLELYSEPIVNLK